jgi:hypothetical protein
MFGNIKRLFKDLSKARKTKDKSSAITPTGDPEPSTKPQNSDSKQQPKILIASNTNNVLTRTLVIVPTVYTWVLILIGLYSLLPISKNTTPQITESRSQQIENSRTTSMSNDEISKKANLITAKLVVYRKGAYYHGSGFIIKKSRQHRSSNNKYYLLTTRHIWKESPNNELVFSITLSDKIKYKGEICNESLSILSAIVEYDLQVICFKSKNEYEIAKISQNKVKTWDNVYILGYKCIDINTGCNKSKFVTGNIGLTDLFSSNLTLIKGYSVPYTNQTDEGMSGSPVLDSSAEVVAIHGLGKNAEAPVSNNSPYSLSDKTLLTKRNKDMAEYFSWGIALGKIKLEQLP